MNRIRELRKQRKLTQKELAKHLQIADSTLSYWEMGKYEPDYAALRKLSGFFHVSIDYILGGDYAQWIPADASMPYAAIAKPSLADAAAIVSDNTVSYNTKDDCEDATHPPPAAFHSDTLGDASSADIKKAAFDRSEFEGLTHEEMEKLAEYAVFLKMLREKKAAKQ